MNKIVLLILLLALLASACTQVAPVSPPPATQTPPVKGIPASSGWEQEWNRVVAEARKEGSVRVYANWIGDARDALRQAFGNKFGISLEFSPFTGGSDMLAKVQAEQGAGLYLADMFGIGATTFITTMKPANLLGDIEAMLLLPEVKDPKVWRDNVLPFLDEDHKTIGMIGMVLPTLYVNTNLVKEGEITSIKDLLKPQYHGKITMNDPSVPSAGNAVVALLADYIWNHDEALDFFKQLLKNGMEIQRDNRLQVETVARGKFAIGLGSPTDPLAQFMSAGAPIGIPAIKEPPNGTASGGGLGVPTRVPHPNAAKVFLNWMLSKEGQSIFARAYGSPSRRLDASVEGINPIFIPQPGQKIHWDVEKSILNKGKIMAETRAIIEASKK